MSGLCGALHGAGGREPDAVAADLAAMAGTLIGATSGVQRQATERAGVAGVAHAGTVQVAREGPLLAVIDGQPRWRDEALAARANEAGDAHALLAAWREHGREGLARLGGAFALAAIDAASGRALLAIDRLGQRPLAYTLTGDGTLCFASSATALRAHPAVDARIDPQAIFDYMYFHVIPSPQTVYRGIDKLAPAECVTFEDGRCTRHTYWRPTFEAADDTPVEDLVAEVRGTLRDAVRRCEPDAATGSFLSGGLDSSTVTGILAELCEQPRPAYTIGFEAAGYDEMFFARIAARHFASPLHEYYVTPGDIIEAIGPVARAYDEPFGNSSAIPAYVCARRAHEDGTRTLLAGDGGDEIFAGNERYAKQQLFEVYYRAPGWLRRALIEPVLLAPPCTALPGVRKVSSYVRQARLPMPERTQTYNLLHRVAAGEIFTPELLAEVDTAHPLALLGDTYHSTPSDELLNRMLYMDWKFTLADNDLRKVSRTCELAGVTVKYPFLDDALVEFSTRVPSRLKLRGGELRHFFKQACTGFLPPEVIAKSKHGFGLPFGSWLREHRDLQERTYESLRALKARDYVQAPFIDRLVEQHRSEHAAFFGGFVWVFAMLEEWLQAHAH